MRRLLNKLFNRKDRGTTNEFDEILERARQNNAQRFLIVWNRGLGDIALGLYALTERIKTIIPDAKQTIMTRKELEEAFLLLEEISVISVPWWQRGRPVDLDDTFRRVNMKKSDYHIIFERVDPTKWLSWQIGKLTPRLKWKDEYDNLWNRFRLKDSLYYIAAHVDTETQQFYGYKKDWPLKNWRALFEVLCKQSDIRVILFGLKKTTLFSHSSIIDLRGETSLLEMLSIIKNCCKILIAPDGGVLSITYYLDVFFPLTVISLWGDANQGIMKQAVHSPNQGLIHIPLVGKGKDVSRIPVDTVLSHIHPAFK